MRGLLLAIALSLASQATHAQAPAAFTACGGGGPVIYVRMPMPTDSLTMLELLTHERVHAKQLARFPSCEAGVAYFHANIPAQLTAEAEAICAGVATLPTTRQHARRAEYAAYLRNSLPTDSGSVEVALSAACGDRVGIAR